MVNTATNEVSLAVSNESEEPAIYLNQPIFDQPDIEGTGKFFVTFPSNKHVDLYIVILPFASEQDSVTVQDDDVENGKIWLPIVYCL